MCEVLRMGWRIGRTERGGRREVEESMVMAEDADNDDEPVMTWRLLSNANYGGRPRHRRVS